MRLFGGISKHCALFINSFSVMIYLISKQKKIYQKVWKNHMIVDSLGVVGFFLLENNLWVKLILKKMQLKEELMMQSNMKSFFLRRRRGGNYDGTSVRLTARQRFFTQRKLKKSVTLLLLLESITLCLKILQKVSSKNSRQKWKLDNTLVSIYASIH